MSSIRVIDGAALIEMGTADGADVYIATDWSLEAARRVSWETVCALDQAGLRAVGDMRNPENRQRPRLSRIMQECSGVVAVLPHFRNAPETTSPILVDALRAAAEHGLPMVFIHHPAGAFRITDAPSGTRVQLGSDVDGLSLEIRELLGAVPYDPQHGLSEGDLESELRGILDTLSRRPCKRSEYAVLITRLEKDFAQAREAVRLAVEAEAGIPCFTSDDPPLRTNIESVRERTRLLIKHASLVVADLTLGYENPDHENPSRGHEIGLAVAYDRPLMLCSQEPRRVPYFSIADMQMAFWETEPQLYRQVRDWIGLRRDALGRQVFNRGLSEVFPAHKSTATTTSFNFDERRRYVGPQTLSLPFRQGWVIAACFAILAFSLSRLAGSYLGNVGSLQVAPLVAAVFTFLFASRFHVKLHEWLRRYPTHRGVLLVTTVLAVVASLQVNVP